MKIRSYHLFIFSTIILIIGFVFGVISRPFLERSASDVSGIGPGGFVEDEQETKPPIEGYITPDEGKEMGSPTIDETEDGEGIDGFITPDEGKEM